MSIMNNVNDIKARSWTALSAKLRSGAGSHGHKGTKRRRTRKAQMAQAMKDWA